MNMYREINKDYIEKVFRVIEKTYKGGCYDLYINGYLHKRMLTSIETKREILRFYSYKGIINQDPVFKSDIYLWLND